MKIKILAFGIARDIIGGSSIDLQAKEGLDVQGFRRDLNSKYPKFSDLTSLMIAVNNEYAEDTQLLNENDEISAVVGKPRTNITNNLRLLKLDSFIQDCLINKTLSAGHGKILAGLPKAFQHKLAQQCVQNGWSVRHDLRVSGRGR